MPLLLAFLLIPLIEIALFIQIGGLIGLWPTLGLVLLAGVLGVWIIRRQGLAAMAQVQSRLRTFRDPAAPLAHGALTLLAGALLILPGFFSDACGLLLLIPMVRDRMLRGLRARASVQPDLRPRPDPTIIDAEYYEVDPDTQRVKPPSDWTRR